MVKTPLFSLENVHQFLTRVHLFLTHDFFEKKGENSTIDVNTVKIYSKMVSDFKLIDNVKILQTVLLKQLPPKRCNGLINLIYATRRSAKERKVEIQSTLVKICFYCHSQTKI